ncbi:hypothetical protein LTR17_020217 [Elasticomyces elasticus]|nr:hypothetical protein LTR17_020217 [Elasticomyces elasticus]
MVQLSKLLTLLAATLAAGAPLDLEKRTDGTATTVLCDSAGCDNCNTGTRTAMVYGQKYTSPMETFKSIRYTGTHTGQAVSQIQLCVSFGDGSGSHCKSGKPGQAFCFTPGGSIRSSTVVGIK